MGKDIRVVSMDAEAIAVIKKNRKNKMVIQIKDDRFLLQLLLISLRLPFP